MYRTIRGIQNKNITIYFFLVITLFLLIIFIEQLTGQKDIIIRFLGILNIIPFLIFGRNLLNSLSLSVKKIVYFIWMVCLIGVLFVNFYGLLKIEQIDWNFWSLLFILSSLGVLFPIDLDRNLRWLFRKEKVPFSSEQKMALYAIVLLNGLLTYIFFLNVNIGLQADEIFQGQAMKEILQKGVPLFDSGLFYSRGILISYLGSFLALIFGTLQEWMIRLPNLIFLLGFIWFIYFQFRKYVPLGFVTLFVYVFSLNQWTLHMMKLSRLYLPLTVVIFIFTFFFAKYFATFKNQFFYIQIALFVVGFLIHKGILAAFPLLVISGIIFIIQNRKRFLLLITLIGVPISLIGGLIYFNDNSELFSHIKNLEFGKLLRDSLNIFLLKFLSLHMFALLTSLSGLGITYLYILKHQYWKNWYTGVSIAAFVFFVAMLVLQVKIQPRYYYFLFVFLIFFSSIYIFTLLNVRNKRLRTIGVGCIVAGMILQGMWHAHFIDYGFSFETRNAISFAVPTVYNAKAVATDSRVQQEGSLIISFGSNDLVHTFYNKNVDFYVPYHKGEVHRSDVPYLKFKELKTKIETARKENKEVYMLIHYEVFPQTTDLKTKEKFAHYSQRIQKFILRNTLVVKDYKTTSLRKVTDKEHNHSF